MCRSRQNVVKLCWCRAVRVQLTCVFNIYVDIIRNNKKHTVLMCVSCFDRFASVWYVCDSKYGVITVHSTKKSFRPKSNFIFLLWIIKVLSCQVYHRIVFFQQFPIKKYAFTCQKPYQMQILFYLNNICLLNLLNQLQCQLVDKHFYTKHWTRTAIYLKITLFNERCCIKAFVMYLYIFNWF